MQLFFDLLPGACRRSRFRFGSAGGFRALCRAFGSLLNFFRALGFEFRSAIDYFKLIHHAISPLEFP